MSDFLTRSFIFLGGKGGVGKTSLATSLGIFTASKGIDTLIISTDPAHSLSDALDQEIGSDEVKVKNVDNLYALEIDSERATMEYASLLDGNSNELLNMILGEGEDLSGMTPPGTDESIAFAKVLEFIETPTHDLIIFDTAPTGHTLRLLSLPDVMDSWLFKIISLPKKLGSLFGGLKSLFGGGDDSDGSTQTSLKELQNRVKIAKEVLKDSTKTEFIPITIPTLMSVWETDRLLTSLKEFNIASNTIIINQINPENTSCEYCTKRNNQQKSLISEFKDLHENHSIIELEMLSDELRGVEKIQELNSKTNLWI